MSGIAKSATGSGGRSSDVLRVLQDAGTPLSISTIADELGVHPNTVRFHLDTLLGDGRVEYAESDHRGRGRPALMFRAVRQMDRGGTRDYRLLAEILTIGLASDTDPSSKALAAGRAWAKRIRPPTGSAGSAKSGEPAKPADADEAVGDLVEMLDELGFDPDVIEGDGETRVDMRHCPFLELAESRTEVVCPIHLGLMQGALETWGAPIEVSRLDPFAEPDMCRAHLAMKTPGRRPAKKGRVRVEHSETDPVRVEGNPG